MDLNTIDAVVRPCADHPTAGFRDGDAWLAGGTWLFSEPQPDLRRLVDLAALDWPALAVTPDGLHLAATCTFATLATFTAPPAWRAAALIRPCCEALLGSFKIWNMATVGGNLCLALPAGPIAALATALDATCRIWTPRRSPGCHFPPAPHAEVLDQRSSLEARTSVVRPSRAALRPPQDEEGRASSHTERQVPAADFIHGTRRTVLAPGEILRSIEIPVTALERHTAFRRASLTPLGRSAVLLIGTLAADGAFALTVTAATHHPVQVAFPALPSAAPLQDALAAAIPDALIVDDVHGRPDWRRHMTIELAESIRVELQLPEPRA